MKNRRILLLATLIIPILFAEVLLLNEYSQTRLNHYLVTSYNPISTDIPTNSEIGESNILDSGSEGIVAGLNSISEKTKLSKDSNPTPKNSTNPTDSGSQTNNTQTPKQSPSKSDYFLDFSSMANGTSVSSMFRIQNGINDDWDPAWNDEKQMYKTGNVKIENGLLTIQAKVESDGTITSGKVDTKGFFDATYGKFEIVAKLPSGIGTFPAIWLLPTDGSYFHDNIATQQEKQNELSYQGDGEIDIIEFLGVEPSYVYHDAHTFNSLVADNDPYSKGTKVSNLSTQFHTYGIEWKTNSIQYTVDGTVVHTVNKSSTNFRDWPFTKPFYFIINLAMGGEWNDILLSQQGKHYPNGIDNSQQNNWIFQIKSIAHYPLN